MSEEEKKEVMFFHCDTKLKSDFYKMAQDKNLSPASFLRAFMRKAVKTWNEENSNNKTKTSTQENYDDEV
jgi:hypothetical protein